MILSVIISLLLSGCRCVPVVEEPMPVATSLHYAGWTSLSRSVSSGDLPQSRVEARDLIGGALIADQRDEIMGAVDRVGSSLGFLQAAKEKEDLKVGLIRAAVACGGCHEAAGATAFEQRPIWSHKTAFEWAVFGLVWTDEAMPERGEDVLSQGLAESYTKPTIEVPDTGKPHPIRPGERVGALLEACWGCHVP